MGKTNSTGYSADVRIWLIASGTLVELSHAAGTFIIAKCPVELPAGDAHVVFSIDETRYERPVTLVKGMTQNCREAVVAARGGEWLF